jgi:hypothetical protein
MPRHFLCHIIQKKTYNIFLEARIFGKFPVLCCNVEHVFVASIPASDIPSHERKLGTRRERISVRKKKQREEENNDS